MSTTEHLETLFTDVEYLRDFFQNMATTPSSSKRILVIYGVGGVGKSTLLRMFSLFCRRKQIPVGLFDLGEAKDAIGILDSLAKDLAGGGITLRRFSSTLQRYRNTWMKVNRMGAESTGFKVGKTAARALVEVAGAVVPVVGPFVSVLGDVGVEAFMERLQGSLSKSEIELYLNPVELLTEAFLTDVAKEATRRRLVLILDTYERIISSDLDRWVMEWLRGLHPNVLVVIAGRSFPVEAWDRAWPGWTVQARVEELKPMGEDDLRTLIQRYCKAFQGEVEPSQLEALVSFANGLPLVATTATRLVALYNVKEFQAVKTQVIANLVDRLLEEVPEDLARIVEASATLRWFDRAVLRAVLGREIPDATYRELCVFPFVRPVREGKLAIHDVMREFIDENLRIQDPERHRLWHKRAAKYFGQIMEEGEGDDREKFFLERLYHLIRANEESLALEESRMAIEKALGYYQRLFAESIVDLLDRYVRQGHYRRWVDYLRYRITFLNPDINRQVAEAEKLLKMLDGPELDPHLEALIKLALADTPAEANISPDRKIKLLKEAIESGFLSLREVAKGHLYLGHIYREKPEWKNSLDNLSQAVQLCESQDDLCGEIWALQWLAYTFLLMGHWNSAVEKAQKAVALSRRSGGYRLTSTLQMLGWAYTYCGRLDIALKAIRESLSLAERQRDETMIIRISRRLAEIYDRQRRWDLSVPLYQSLMEEDEKFGRVVSKATFMTLLGVSYLRQGLYGQAELLLLKGLPYMHIHFKQVTLNALGKLCLILKKLDESRQYFEHALSLSKDRPYYIAQSVMGLLQVDIASSELQGISDKAQQVEELSINFVYYDHLARLRLLQAHIAWEGSIPEWGRGFDSALGLYKQALIYALRYNRYLLDEVLWGDGVTTTLQPIVSHCLERGEEGRRMLVALRDWWRTGVNDIGVPLKDVYQPIPEGIPLLEAERIARKQELGDGKIQKTVMERIDEALAV